MATIIDALAVSAGFDPKRFAVDTIAAAAALGQMAQNLNISTERLSAWQKAAARAGGTADAISAQLRESSGQVAKFNRGLAAESLPAFFENGGNVADLRDGNTYLLARSRIIADLYQKDRARAAQTAQEMGVNDALFDLFKRGPIELEKLLQVQERRSAISGRDAEAAKRLHERYLDLRDTFETVGIKILVALMPALERLLVLVQGWGDYLLENREEIVAWVDGLAQAIVTFIDIADSAAQAVGGWHNVLLALGALKILSWVKSLWELASALGSVAAALGSLGGAAVETGLAALSRVGPAALKAAGRVAGGVAMLTYSKNLNAGEPEVVAAMDNPALKRKEVVDAVRFFEARGYVREAAAGLVANLQAQSNLDPRTVGDNGNAYGIGLWNPAQQAAFNRAIGVDIRESTLVQQLRFVDWELRNTRLPTGRKLAGSKTPMQAGELVYRDFGLSRPDGDDEGEARRRGAAAGAIYGAVFTDDLQRSSVSAASIATAAQASAVGAPSSTTTTSNTSETHIHGPVTVVTQATDAPGFARDLVGIGRSQGLVQQGNTGIF